MKKYLLTGLIIILPVILTLILLLAIVNLLTQPFLGLITFLLSLITGSESWLSPLVLQLFSQALILILLFFATTAIGYLGNHFFVNQCIKFTETWIHRIPFASDIYKTVKDAVDIFINKGAFQKTALTPFPNKPSQSISFIGGEKVSVQGYIQIDNLTPQCIFGAPNPMMGFLILVPSENTLPLDLPPKSASRFIFSCGILSPESQS